MAALAYPCRIREAADCWLVSFPDLPEALTFGPTMTKAANAAEDCLKTALRSRIRDRDDVPPASAPPEGACLILVDTATEEMVARHQRNLTRARAL